VHRFQFECLLGSSYNDKKVVVSLYVFRTPSAVNRKSTVQCVSIHRSLHTYVEDVQHGTKYQCLGGRSREALRLASDRVLFTGK
jgi:hypothetical protein